MFKPKKYNFSYKIRRSFRAKKIHINVSLNKIEVVIPQNLSPNGINTFVTANTPWINDTLKT